MIEQHDAKSSSITLHDGEVIIVPDHYIKLVRMYLISNNAAKSYRELYDPEGKQGSQSCASSAYKILSRPDVFKVIEYFRSKFNDALDISEKRVLAELAACGLYNIADAFDDEGKMLKPHEMTPATSRAMQSYRCKTTTDNEGNEITQAEVMFANKISALKTIAEIKGMGKINESGATTVIINKANMAED